MPTPRDLATTHQYAYELEPGGVTLADRDERNLPHTIVRVSVFVRTWNGDPRPTSVVASTTSARSLMAATPLAGFPTGPNDDPRLLDLFADHIADAEHRATLTRLAAAGAVTPMLTVDEAKRLHPAYAPSAPRSLEEQRAAAFAPAARPGGDLYVVTPAHVCQHGNRLHPCRCAATADHSSRVCVEADRG